MENLFMDFTPTCVYDLKGSKRARYIHNPTDNEVLLDENLLEVIYSSPPCLDESTKIKLQASAWNDSLFLSLLGVMDYSLLAGFHHGDRKIRVGIIDYMRKYTWDKQLETWVKSTGLMGGRGKIPTVISPDQYKARFLDALNHYFLAIPTVYTPFRLTIMDGPKQVEEEPPR
jgi:1-phosphatidylinositol-3-phosphate 5-kinase